MKRQYDLPFILSPLILLALLSSCSITKHTTKDVTKADTEVKTAETDVKSTLTTETHTTTERFESPILVPGDSLQGQVSIKDLVNAGEFDLKDGDEEVKVQFDSVRRKLRITAKVSPRTVQAPGERVTVSTSTVLGKEKDDKVSDEKDKIVVEKKTLDKKVTGINLNYLWLFAAVPFLWICFVLWKKRKEAKAVIDKAKDVL